MYRYVCQDAGAVVRMNYVRCPGLSMKILIVDDNATIRRLISHVVREIAEEIRECTDGNLALSAYADFQPDIVLMDIRMPGTDGLIATRQLKGKYPSARIFIVTDYDDDEMRNAARDAGASGYALKQNLTSLEDLILSQ